MIKKITDENLILSFGDKEDIYSIRIKALVKAYSTSYDFASFYALYNDDGIICAVISRLDNDFTVYHNRLTSRDELEISSFLCACTYSSVLTDDKISLANMADFDYGYVMKSTKKFELSAPFAEIDEYPKLMDLFDLESYDKWDFNAWYVDLSHRIRHNTAKAYALKINDELVASGVFSSIYNNSAILSSVLTQPPFRGLGYGSALVSKMIGDIRGDVYIMREKDKNESFYNKLGFENIGIWRMYK